MHMLMLMLPEWTGLRTWTRGCRLTQLVRCSLHMRGVPQDVKPLLSLVRQVYLSWHQQEPAAHKEL